MRLCTIAHEGKDQGSLLLESRVIPFESINTSLGTSLPENVGELIFSGRIEELRSLLPRLQYQVQSGIPMEEAVWRAPYLHPGKIWGIGLNYPRHAGDLREQTPMDEPASFMKPDTTIIGPGQPVRLPPQSRRVTGEAEIGVIIGQECKDVPLNRVRDVILGYTTIIDMTAEDILKRNPRFLTRSKSFDTFFSFGPLIVTADEIEDVNKLTITTWHNGRKHRAAPVGDMTFPPFELVSFHSHVMTLKPGDIISCGTPGAAPLAPGDVVGCTVDQIGSLENPVQAY